VKVREVIRLIGADGWHNVKVKGGHRQYKHPVKRGRVAIPGRPNDDLAPKTLASILKQVGLSEDRGS
jgi:predicted RNA binding protein YcfA (HicA-like mRNA interferase family)